MLELDRKEKMKIKKFLNTGGYVFNFSTSAFDAFTYGSIGIKLCEKYKLSKGKSLEAFIDESKSRLIITLLKDFLDYYDVYKSEFADDMVKENEYKIVCDIVEKFYYYLPIIESKRDSRQKEKNKNLKRFDVFISHANYDKLAAVNDLRNELSSLGVNIWYDADNIEWGDSISGRINEGLKNCEYGILVLSKTYFSRKWCNNELEELLRRKNEENENIVLPLLLNITINEAIDKYPFLEDIKMVEYIKGQERDIAILFAKIIIKRLKNLVAIYSAIN